MIHQLIDQGILSAEDEGDQGFGIKIKLQECMELGKDFDAHQVGFVNDQDGLLFLGGHFGDNPPEGFGQEGDGEATGLNLKGQQDLFKQFEDGAGVAGNGDDPVLGGVKGGGGIAQGGGFSRAHLSGDDTDGAQVKSIEESVLRGP